MISDLRRPPRLNPAVPLSFGPGLKTGSMTSRLSEGGSVIHCKILWSPN